MDKEGLRYYASQEFKGIYSSMFKVMTKKKQIFFFDKMEILMTKHIWVICDNYALLIQYEFYTVVMLDNLH